MDAAVRAGLIAYGHWLFRWRNRVFPVVMLTLFAAFAPRLAGGSLVRDQVLDCLGFAVAASGQLLRALVIGLAYIKRGGVNKRVHASTLVTDGIFAHARNPLYVGNLMILAGLLIIHNHPAVYVLGGVFFLCSYQAIVAAEEQYLAKEFGAAYLAYCAQVPRWGFHWGGLGATLHAQSFNWRRVMAKDSPSCATWLVMALALFVYEAFRNGLRVEAGLRLEVALLVTAGLVLALGALTFSRKRQQFTH